MQKKFHNASKLKFTLNFPDAIVKDVQMASLFLKKD